MELVQKSETTLLSKLDASGMELENVSSKLDKSEMQVKLLQAEILALKKENNALTFKVSEMDARIMKLEKQLGRDDSNSSVPPSASKHKPKTPNKNRSLREKTGNKPGGQVGHEGSNLKFSEHVDEVVDHFPGSCANCGIYLEGVEPEKNVGRQVFDLPENKLKVTEHRSHTKICPVCGHKNTAPFPAEVKNHTQYGSSLTGFVSYLVHYQMVPFQRASELIEDIFSQKISVGTLVTMTQRVSAACKPAEELIKSRLKGSPVINLDETGLYVGGKRWWEHVTSNKSYTYYYPHVSRGHLAVDEIGILPGYTGTAVHDNWATYFMYPDCVHALCNVHHLRELKGLVEFGNHKWAEEMKGLLMKAKEFSETNPYPLEADGISEIETAYQNILEQGIKETPRQRNGANDDAIKLLNRFSERQEEILEFLYQEEVPFHNNQAENDVRMTKVKQKISGTFRTSEGAMDYTRTRSVMSTFKKQGIGILRGLKDILVGKPCPIV